MPAGRGMAAVLRSRKGAGSWGLGAMKLPEHIQYVCAQFCAVDAFVRGHVQA